jgi:hypothetical protein
VLCDWQARQSQNSPAKVSINWLRAGASHVENQELRCGIFTDRRGCDPLRCGGTPSDFEHFVAQDKYIPPTIRFHSPGGLLVAGVELGQKIRAHGFNTEVGSDLWDPKGEPKDWRVSARRPGVCASACAYAFLGGVERTLDEDSRFGVHRFYSQKSLDQPTARQFTGDDLDGTQRLMAGLMLYVMLTCPISSDQF